MQPDDIDKDDFLPFCRPAIDSSDIAAVVGVLESGWITTGAKTRQLEEMMCALTGCRDAVAVSSATAGMHLALHALDIGPGDEVITPSMTWVSTVNLIVLRGATPVFVDIDPGTLMAGAPEISAAITPRTRLIIPVHYAGASLDLEPLRQLAIARGIPLVEDAAHALGTAYQGIPVGRSGTAIFSFQAIKNVTTAEGGMICTDDAELAERLRRLRFHGLGADAYDRKTQGRTPSAEVLEPGFKYNLPDMNACLALGQLKRLEHLNESRSLIAERYGAAFADMKAIRPLALPDYPFSHSWHLFVVRVDSDALKLSREQFMDELKQKQIGTGIHFRAVHHHRYYRETLSGKLPALPNTDWNSDRIVTLPLFPTMQERDVDRVIRGIRDIVEAVGT